MQWLCATLEPEPCALMGATGQAAGEPRAIGPLATYVALHALPNVRRPCRRKHRRRSDFRGLCSGLRSPYNR